MVSLRVHNILDYVGGAILLLCPYIFGFSDVTAARNLFLVLGFGLIGYSLLTNYQYSVFKVIPLGVHMALDMLAGVVLILGSYVFGYRGAITGGQTALHYVLGIGVIGLVALTRPKTDQGRLMTGKPAAWITPKKAGGARPSRVAAVSRGFSPRLRGPVCAESTIVRLYHVGPVTGLR